MSETTLTHLKEVIETEIYQLEFEKMRLKNDLGDGNNERIISRLKEIDYKLEHLRNKLNSNFSSV